MLYYIILHHIISSYILNLFVLIMIFASDSSHSQHLRESCTCWRQLRFQQRLFLSPSRSSHSSTPPPVSSPVLSPAVSPTVYPTTAPNRRLEKQHIYANNPPKAFFGSISSTSPRPLPLTPLPSLLPFPLLSSSSPSPLSPFLSLSLSLTCI